ncbi:MAG: hypothetical protein HC831_03315 [Chloroflexia bacterium]|nr:hypothetical protein [Chloroflexia bacterium]
MSLYFLLGSCEEAKDIIPLPTMNATVDNEGWNTNATWCIYNKSGKPQNIEIIGSPTLSKTADKVIVLTILGNTTGTYQFGIGTVSANCNVVYKKTSDAIEGGDNYYVAYEATITISEMNTEKKTISGSFSAKCINTALVPDEVIITNGTFKNVFYTEE